jgi:hypothetical protein
VSPKAANTCENPLIAPVIQTPEVHSQPITGTPHELVMALNAGKSNDNSSVAVHDFRSPAMNCTANKKKLTMPTPSPLAHGKIDPAPSADRSLTPLASTVHEPEKSSDECALLFESVNRAVLKDERYYLQLSQALDHTNKTLEEDRLALESLQRKCLQGEREKLNLEHEMDRTKETLERKKRAREHAKDSWCESLQKEQDELRKKAENFSKYFPSDRK